MTDRLDELQRLHEAMREAEDAGLDDGGRACGRLMDALPALLRVARAAKHLRTAMTTPPKGYGDEPQGYWWTAATEKAAEEVAEAVQAMDAGGYAPKP